jgi:hypothetical protein
MVSSSFPRSTAGVKVPRKMPNRRLVFLLFAVLAVCAIAAGVWYYQSKCHGWDACAAVDAESHERDRPSDPQ